MRKIFLLTATSVALLMSSCQKTVVNVEQVEGYLSFSEFELMLDEEEITKSSPASGNYTVLLYDADGNEVLRKSYAEVKNDDNKLSVAAGQYKLIVRSTDEEVPTAAFEQPVYGASQDVAVVAGETTAIGEVTCTLLQCKVTVSYSDEFLNTMSGAGTATVELTNGYPLVFNVNENKTYDQSAGYFAVNGNTMTVSFKGNIGGKTMTMNKVFTGIAPRQWRQVKFINKVNEEGTATFDIVISDLISDEVLNSGLLAEEEIIGVDPNAPQDDGGIKLLLADDCDKTIVYSEENLVYDGDGNKINYTGLIHIPIAPMPSIEEDPEQKPTMSIKFDAFIPSGLAEMTVDISTDSPNFASAVATANATHIDLVNPTCDDLIFVIVPFPHGSEILGAEEINFDLSNAQGAIVGFSGTHEFTMTIVDANGKTKINKITMFVE